MISLEEAAAELDEIADNIPNEFFIQLNGGICILPDIKYHPELPSGRYFNSGEYIRNSGLGRYICIYYGSFSQVYRNAPKHVWREKLQEVLRHELRHHVEGLAGVNDLEVEDARFVAEAKERERNAKMPGCANGTAIAGCITA